MEEHGAEVTLRQQWANIGLVMGIEIRPDCSYEWEHSGVINRLELRDDTTVVLSWLDPETRSPILKPVDCPGFRFAGRDLKDSAALYFEVGKFAYSMEVSTKFQMALLGVINYKDEQRRVQQ